MEAIAQALKVDRSGMLDTETVAKLVQAFEEAKSVTITINK